MKKKTKKSMKKKTLKTTKRARTSKLPRTKLAKRTKSPSKLPPKTIFVSVERSSGRVRVADANRAFVERWTMGLESLYSVEQYGLIERKKVKKPKPRKKK